MDTSIDHDVQIPLHAEVSCSDGLCGQSTNVLVNPVTEKVTHVVVKTGAVPSEEFIVPIEVIDHTDATHIQLRLTKAEFAHLDLFNKTEYIVESEPTYITGLGVGTYMYWPYAMADVPIRVPVEHPQIPPGELAVRRGTSVEASDGAVGNVDEFIVDAKTGNITHLVMREGHLWGKKDVSIPVSAIKEMHDGTVTLNLSRQEIEALPNMSIKRKHTQ